MLGKKRERGELNWKDDSYYQMLDFLDNLFTKNEKMTYEDIDKEMRKEFTGEDVEKHLKNILDKQTKLFSEKGVTYYFKC